MPSNSNLITEGAIKYIPANWPKNNVISLMNRFARAFRDEMKKPSSNLRLIFPGPDFARKAADLAGALDKIKEVSKSLTPQQSTAKSELAIKVGWRFAGGFNALEMYTAGPKSMWMMDREYIRLRLQQFGKYLGAGSEFNQVLDRNVDYIRRHLNKHFLQKGDPNKKVEAAMTNEIQLTGRGPAAVHTFFAILLGSWMHCPLCYRIFFSATSVSGHLNHCNPGLFKQEHAAWKKNPRNWSLNLNDRWHCPLCDFSSQEFSHVWQHLREGRRHKAPVLLKMGFLKHMAADD